MRSRLFALVPFCLLAGLDDASAANAGVAGREEAIPIVLSPSRLPQPFNESPSPVTVLDRETIRASGARKIGDLLRLVPGMVVGSIDGAYQTVAYHGLSDEFSRRIQVRIDGRSIYNPADGSAWWLNQPLQIDNIERIEVIRGPSAASYGSNAMMATINIETRHASEVRGMAAVIGEGSEGEADRSLRWGGAWGAGDVFIAVSQQRDEGFDDVVDRREDRGLFMRADYPLNRHDELQVELGVSRNDYRIGDSSDPRSRITEPLRTAHRDTDFQFVRWLRKVSAAEEFSLRLARTRNENRDRDVAFSAWTADGSGAPVFRDLTIDRSYAATRHDLEFEHRKSPGPDLDLVWGAGYRQDDVDGAAYTRDPATQDEESWRMFGRFAWDFAPRWILNAGLTAEDTTHTESTLLPQAALLWQPEAAHTLRLAVSDGSRIPRPYERDGAFHATDSQGDPYYKVLASGSLERERVRSVELGYVYAPARGMHFDARLYRDHFEDLITSFRTASSLPAVVLDPASFTGPMVTSFANADSVIVRGGEAQMDWQWGQTRLRAAYARTRIESEDVAHDRGYEVSAPQDSLSALVSRPLGKHWSGSLNYSHVDGFRWYFQDRPIDSYDKLDVRLAYENRIQGADVTVELIGRNLAGEVADFRPGAAWDQGVYCRVGLDF